MQNLDLQEKYFNQVAIGLKTVEGRKMSPTWLSLKTGDMLNVVHNDLCFRATISDIHYYSSELEDPLKTMLETEGIQNMLPGIKSIQDAIETYKQFWTDEEIKRLGVMAIHLSPEDNNIKDIMNYRKKTTKLQEKLAKIERKITRNLESIINLEENVPTSKVLKLLTNVEKEKESFVIFKSSPYEQVGGEELQFYKLVLEKYPQSKCITRSVIIYYDNPYDIEYEDEDENEDDGTPIFWEKVGKSKFGAPNLDCSGDPEDVCEQGWDTYAPGYAPSEHYHSVVRIMKIVK